jgi:hypothetical protein
MTNGFGQLPAKRQNEGVRILALSLFALLGLLLCATDCTTGKVPILGVTMVAPREKGQENPLIPAQKIGFGWMAIVPYGFLQKDSAKVKYAEVSHRMWGERPEGIRQSAAWAREQGMKVMLKPQVWARRTWIGAIAFEQEQDWKSFEDSYIQYIVHMAEIAESEHIEMLCIGTELSEQALSRTAFWAKLIADVRKVYKGRLTYSANWDNWEKVPFWRDLDYIGLGSYFPLSHSAKPTVDSLKLAWKPIVARLEAASKAVRKPVLFTEMGYLGVPGCCGRLWELEPKRHELPVDAECQAKAFEALLSVFMPKPWWAGGFVWKYYPQTVMSPDYGDKDYDIQGKPAAEVFRKMIKKKK